MGRSDIPYVDRVWEVTAGCRPRSAGCRNCSARHSVNRLAGHPAYRQHLSGLVEKRGNRLAWTGKITLLDHLLEVPLKLPPSRIFVNSKSELFDEAVPFEYLHRVFGVMARCPQHRFLIVTKEAERLSEFVRDYVACGAACPEDFRHVVLIVSVESEKCTDRLARLIEIPAALRGVSLEPLIEPVDLSLVDCSAWETTCIVDALRGRIVKDSDKEQIGAPTEKLDWVIVGCEKLAGGWAGRWAGEDPLAWWAHVRRLVRECQAADISVFIKQGPELDLRPGVRLKVTTDLQQFPPECRVQQVPAALEPERRSNS